MPLVVGQVVVDKKVVARDELSPRLFLLLPRRSAWGPGLLLLWHEAQLSAKAILPRFSTSASVVR